MEMTSTELSASSVDAAKIETLRRYLIDHPSPDPGLSVETWFQHLLDVKAILSNLDNSLSFAACLLAKSYLERVLPMRPFDVSLKSQSAPGLDFDEMTLSRERVIAELKTTTPYRGTRFGAKQHEEVKKDIAKLTTNSADHKFYFFTDPRAADEALRLFPVELSGIKVVCLACD